MPTKKKKYNARFPPARIKKIMQGDEEVGKVAAAVPVVISRALELFIEALLVKSSQVTQINNSRTLSASHIKQTVVSDGQFSFLRGLVANIPDVRNAEDDKDTQLQQQQKQQQHHIGVTAARPRGRPRKQQPVAVESTVGSAGAVVDMVKQGQKRKISTDVSDHINSDEDDDDDEGDTDSDSQETQSCDEVDNSNSGDNDDNNDDETVKVVSGATRIVSDTTQLDDDDDDDDCILLYSPTDCDHNTEDNLSSCHTATTTAMTSSSGATHRMPAKLPLATVASKQHYERQRSQTTTNNNDMH